MKNHKPMCSVRDHLCKHRISNRVKRMSGQIPTYYENQVQSQRELYTVPWSIFLK